MRIMHAQCAALDVHKRTVTATRRHTQSHKEVEQETSTFGTMTADLLGLVDWLHAWEVTHVAMESTGEYWKPIYNLLEGEFVVILVNAQHVKHVPGRKTDVIDAEWLAELLSYGLLKPSFIPPKPQRELRDLTRYRTTLVQERARVVNRVQKLLESANIKLASVATDIFGVSGRSMLAALAAGLCAPGELAELAKGRLRHKLAELQKALTGVVDDHHRFLLTQQLAHVDFLDEQIEQLSEEIGHRLEAMTPLGPDTPSAEPEATHQEDGHDATPSLETATIPDAQAALTWPQAVALLDTIPGVDRATAEVMLAEMGLDMQQFPSAAHLAAWTGLAPGNHQSGGKRSSGRTPPGNRALRTILVQAAWAASHTKNTYLASLYHRLAGRRGKKRAIVAVAHSILVSAYHMLARCLPYQELGGDYLDLRQKEHKTRWLTRQLEKQGFVVSLELPPSALAVAT
jgi:transposase